MIDLELVVAADEAGGVGKDGKLPWRLRGDTAFFKRLTTTTTAPDRQNAVIMGRRTWQSIPARYRPLPGRLNLVLSRAADLALPEGVLSAARLDAALAQIEERAEGIERAFVIGGGEIYRLALEHPRCRRAYLTRVAGRHGCDTFLPALPASFRLVEQSEPETEDELSYRFETWER